MIPCTKSIVNHWLILNSCTINNWTADMCFLIITWSIIGREMSIKRIITGLILSMLLSSGVAIAADFNKGLENKNE